jgi:hypothetical protein
VIDSTTIEYIDLTFTQYVARHMVAGGLLLDHDANASIDYISGGMVFSLRAKVLTKNESISVKVPSSPWQAWKARYGPQWLVGRWPPVYDEVEMECEITFPHSNLRFPDSLGARVVMMPPAPTLNWKV